MKQQSLESEHFYQCSRCGKLVDMRDLGQVIEHEHADLPKPPQSNSKKVGESVQWIKGSDPVSLN